MKALGSISEYNWCEDGEGVFSSETKSRNENGSEEEENDWYLKGFLVGYRREKNRRHRLMIDQEERAKKECEMRREEKEWRREVRDMIEKEMKKTLDCLM